MYLKYILKTKFYRFHVHSYYYYKKYLLYYNRINVNSASLRVYKYLSRLKPSLTNFEVKDIFMNRKATLLKEFIV